MTAHRRRQLVQEYLRAALLILLAVLLEAGDHFNRVEQLLYDLRAKLCQQYFPPPSDKLVHLDIDDTAVSYVGRVPWDRDRMAEILEEIRLAGPKILTMDLLFAEHSAARFDSKGKVIEPDRIFAAELEKFGRALVPLSLTFEPPQPVNTLDQRLVGFLGDDPELTIEQCSQRLAAAGFSSPTLAQDVGHRYLNALQEALHERILRELHAAPSTQPATRPLAMMTAKADLQKRILPNEDPTALYTKVDRLFDEQYDQAVREIAMERFTFAAPNGLPAPVVATRETAPLVEFGSAAAFSGFVEYLPEREGGSVRRVPLLASYRGRLFPQMGFATACAVLGVELRDLQFTSQGVVLPRKDGPPITIPVSRRQQTLIGPAAWLMELPIIDPAESWQAPERRRSGPAVEHLSVYEIWQICQMRQSMENNNKVALKQLLEILGKEDPETAAKLAAHPPSSDELRKKMNETIVLMRDRIKQFEAMKDLDKESLEELKKEPKKTETVLSEALKQNSASNQQLNELRVGLSRKLKGKALFMGDTATGRVDVVPTSLYYACPGVVVHGAVFNAIMTGKMWRVAPRGVTMLIMIAIGVLTALFISAMSPMWTFLATSTMTVGYVLVNGYVLFDSHNLIVGLSGPIFTAVLVYSVATLLNFITEVLERNRITRRFSNYVDPKLVNYVIEHPEQARFDGEAREMTMGFTDLAGFTTMTEALGPRAVPLLGEYMSKMIPTIRANKGYVSRLMGDGIFFFFNAPGADPDHAINAVSTVLSMHEALRELNATLPARNYPTLGMRAGICTGNVVVGDAGSAEFSDYTAIGDPVNTAARFETANKFFGTRTLASQRTIDLLNGQFLCRPIARLRVAGKTQGIVVYEPLCLAAQATSEHHRSFELSTNLVEAFWRADFTSCVKAAAELDQCSGATQLTDLYRKLSLEYTSCCPPDFNGQVILSEK